MDSFEKKRKELSDALVRMAEKNGEKVTAKTIPFLNDDVPNYLRRLDEFEERSKRSSLMVGSYFVRFYHNYL